MPSTPSQLIMTLDHTYLFEGENYCKNLVSIIDSFLNFSYGSKLKMKGI